MKFIKVISVIVLFGTVSCTTEVVEPELFGSIEGMVISSENNNALQGVSIETAPATEVILTDEQGSFYFEDIATGSYQIKASKPGYKAKSVTVMVKEDRTSSAKILLEPEDEDVDSTENYLDAKITAWRQIGEQDSSTVEVEYWVKNTSETISISEYEVYFDIHTDQRLFNYEITETQLDPEEQSYSSFQKYIEDAVVDSVTIAGTWMKQ